MKHLVLYIHGKGGSAAESRHYGPLFPGHQVVGLDYQAQTPWEARQEFPTAFDELTRGSDTITLIANSIGAFFALCSLQDKPIDKAYFISPVVDMERLITDMMGWANTTEAELQARQTIPTDFGETLSWDYLQDVRTHPVQWNIPTAILYGSHDNLTSRETISAFAKQQGAELTIMEDGEHWFHTPAQMAFLDEWIAGVVACTPRLRLRHFRPGDLADLHACLSDPEAVKYEPYPPMSLMETRQALRWRMSTEEMTAIELNGRVIGNVYLGKRDCETLELGYLLNRSYWHQGYAFEACTALIDRAFAQDVHRIYAECDPENTASWGLVERLGFRREGHLKQNVFFQRDEKGYPLWKDTYLYARLAKG